MAYTKTNWQNGITPLSATNLNKIEQGIVDAGFTYTEENYVMNEIANIINKAKIKRMLFFDAVTGTTITDRMGAANASTSIDTSNFSRYTEGSARVLDFSSNKYWELPDASDLSFGNGAGTDSPFSIVLVCKMNTTSDCTLIAKAQQGSNMEWEVYGGSKLGLKLYSANGSLYNTVYYGSALDTTNYHCIIVTYDGTKAYAGMKIYVDGVQVDNNTAGTGGYATNGMSNTASTVGNFIKQSGGTRINIGNYALAFSSIISEALTTTQITDLTKLLRSYIGHDTNVVSGTKKVIANQFVSTTTTGTAPFAVSSTTKVTNLNADFIDGLESSQLVRNDIIQNLANGSGIKGSDTDTANTAYLKFNESNGTSLQGLVGFYSPYDDTLQLYNNRAGGEIRLSTTYDGVATVNGNTIYHTGNISSSAINLANASGITGTGTGIANMSYLEFDESDGITRQGWVGFGHTTSNTLSIANGINNSDINFITQGTGKASVNGNEIWNTSNFRAVSNTNNTLLGYGTGDNTTGAFNVAFGQYCFTANTTGASNVAIGRQTLTTNTTGTSNTAVGTKALFSNVTTNYNTAIGFEALRANIAANNTAVGLSALSEMNDATATNNTAIGINAGKFYGASTSLNTKSIECVYIGSTTRASAVGNTNEIVIGHNALGYGSNTAHIGNTNVASISFGAGTGTAFTNRSDRRLKEDIIDANLDMCYADIKSLPLHRFKYKDFVGNEGDQHLTGFIADEFEQVFPKAVFKNDHSFSVLDTEGNKVMKTIIETDAEGNEVTREVEETQIIEQCASIDTSQITPTLLGAVQKLMEKVEALEAEITLLKS